MIKIINFLKDIKKNMNIMIRELEDKRIKSTSRDEKYNS